MSKIRLIFLLSHPIQYFSPFFQEFKKAKEFELIVLYCSDENLKGHLDKGFGVNVQWDIDLLGGYDYRFLKNNSWKPSLFNGFWGLINFEIFKVLKKEKGSFLVIHGWNYATNFLAIIAAKLFGVKLCLRGENPLNQELLKTKGILLLRKIFFKYLFFPLFDYFFYIGKQNKELYRFYGVKDEKLIFTPYSVNNNKFKNDYEKYSGQKKNIRIELGLPPDKIILLTSGKYISKKRPLDLLKAYKLLNNNNLALVFLGEGELRPEMEKYINENNLQNVFLTGFKNQSEISKYFVAADIFVLPSGLGETWGLVVNEALNFGLPVIISDLPGSAYDLVENNINGFIYKCGDIQELANKIQDLIADKDKIKKFGSKSLEIINFYSYATTIKNIRQALS